MATTAAIVSIRDELLAGDVENTNASWLAARLTDFGIDVREIRVVPDDAPAIETTVSDLSDTYTLVITTGGSGRRRTISRSTLSLTRLDGHSNPVLRHETMWKQLSQKFRTNTPSSNTISKPHHGIRRRQR
jgi:molybdenum cofactor synthesis domain-containing protein